VVSNAMSADTEFHVNYRRVELESPFLLVAATDGCFGYVPSPMHFEHLVLGPLVKARNVDGWSSAVQSDIAAVTGDDAAMSVMAVGATFPELQRLYADRVRELDKEYTGPIDEMQQAVSRAADELEALRQRQLQDSQRLWARYQPTYEQLLHDRSEPEVPDTVQEGATDEGASVGGTSGEAPVVTDEAQSTALDGGPGTPEEVSP
jgi:hypothetical protein